MQHQIPKVTQMIHSKWNGTTGNFSDCVKKVKDTRKLRNNELAGVEPRANGFEQPG